MNPEQNETAAQCWTGIDPRLRSDFLGTGFQKTSETLRKRENLLRALQRVDGSDLWPSALDGFLVQAFPDLAHGIRSFHAGRSADPQIGDAERRVLDPMISIALEELSQRVEEATKPLDWIPLEVIDEVCWRSRLRPLSWCGGPKLIGRGGPQLDDSLSSEGKLDDLRTRLRWSRDMSRAKFTLEEVRRGLGKMKSSGSSLRLPTAEELQGLARSLRDRADSPTGWFWTSTEVVMVDGDSGVQTPMSACVSLREGKVRLLEQSSFLDLLLVRTIANDFRVVEPLEWRPPPATSGVLQVANLLGG